MIHNLEEVPSGYRYMFHPPIVHSMIDISEGEFDFKAFAKHRDEEILKLNMAFFTGVFKKKSEDEKMLGRLKYASIIEGENQYITFVDKETGKAFRMKDDSYYEGLLCPLVEITNFTFHHWCSVWNCKKQSACLK